MSQISTIQAQIYNFIKSCIYDKGVAPSVREIGSAVGLSSTSSVQYHINALIEKGYLYKDDNLKRTLRLANDMPKPTFVPLIGTVTAGNPILAFENVEDYIPIAKNSNAKNLFALRVKGESMINAAILDGDIVIVEKTPVANNGEIVVAMIDDEATVKRFYKENGHFRLQPENDSFEPIIVDSLSILGKVKTIIRNL